MAAACYNNGTISGAGANQQFFPADGLVCGDFAFGGAFCRVTPEDAPDGRGIDYAQHGNAIFHLGDIDREFTIAGDKFLGAVKGVHEIESVSHGRNAARSCGFFGDDRGIGIEPRQAFQDNALSRLIGFRHGGQIAFGAGAEVGGIDCHDFAPGQKGKVNQ